MPVKFDLSRIEGFDWDEGNLEHIKKHYVHYKECEEIFFNTPLRLVEDQEHSQVEERLQALGKTNKGRFVFIVFTIRENKIRVVSARGQNRKERKINQNGGEKNEETQKNT